MHQAPQPPHDGRRPGLRNPAAGSASAQARPGPHRPRLASHTGGGAPSARVKGEARAFLTADRDARAGSRRRGRACTRRETDERGRARARRQMGRACARRGYRRATPRPGSPSRWGPRPCRLRDPLRRPGLSVERGGRAGAEDLRGARPALARFVHLFKGKRQGSAPSPSVFARAVSSEATTALWHPASAVLSAPGRGEGPTTPAVSRVSLF